MTGRQLAVAGDLARLYGEVREEGLTRGVSRRSLVEFAAFHKRASAELHVDMPAPAVEVMGEQVRQWRRRFARESVLIQRQREVKA